LWWDPRVRRDCQRRVGPRILIKGWHLPVSTEGMTVGGLVRLLRRLSAQDLRTLEILSDVRIAPFLNEAATPSPEWAPGRSSLALVEISKDIVIEPSSPDGCGPVARLDFNCSGRRGPSERPRDYWTIAHLPLMHLERAVLSGARWSRLLDEKTRTGQRVLGRFRAQFTLGELLSCFLGEVAFFGSPSRRQAELMAFYRAIAELKSGKVEGRSFDQVTAELDVREKKERPRSQRRAWQLWRQRHASDRRRRGSTAARKAS